MKCRKLLAQVVGRIVEPSEIDDIVQETFIRSYQAEVRGEIRHPRAFMLKTAANLALNHVARAERRLTDQLDDLENLETSLTSLSPEAEAEANERFQEFCRAASTLPLQCRRVLILRKVYGLSQKEVAEQLGISESTVEKHVAKAVLLCTEYVKNTARTGRTSGEMKDDGIRNRSRAAAK